MMTNLFSIFDPSTSFMKSNWMSLTIPMFLISLSTPVNSSKANWQKNLMAAVFGILSQTLKQKKFIFIPLFSIFFTLLINNFSSMLPLIFPTSSHISVVLPIGLAFWFLPLWFNLVKSSMNMMKSLLPQGTPAPLMPFMIMIEMVSIMIRPITLSVRLVANITAGHLLLSILVSMVMQLKFNMILIVPIMLMNMLELGVSLIQAYVFFTLIMMYTSEI